MDIAHHQKSITVSCPSCGADITIGDQTEEFITCSHCLQVHQISDLLRESDSRHIGRIRYKHYLFPIQKTEVWKEAEMPREKFQDSPWGTLLRRVILCVIGMLLASLVFGAWKLILPLGISLACWILYWQIAAGKGSEGNQKYLKPLAAGGIFFLILMLLV